MAQTQSISTFELPLIPKDVRKLHCESVSLLPCKINYDGPAAISSYFRPEPINDDNVLVSISDMVKTAANNNNNNTQVENTTESTTISSPTTNTTTTSDPSNTKHQFYTATIRGRQITGRKLRLPSDTVGIVLVNDNSRTSVSTAMSAQNIMKSRMNQNININTMMGRDPDIMNDDGNENGEDQFTSISSSQTQIKINIQSKFDEFFVWNRDLSRHENDFLIRSVEEFLPISSALHGDGDGDDEYFEEYQG